MEQTLCPYALIPLSSADSNAEHILPVALGGPRNFTVRSLSSQNSVMNTLIDSPTVNDPMLRFVAMTQGVQSRSGHVEATVDGNIKESDQKVRSTFSHNDGVQSKPARPVETDDQGKVKGVFGFGSDAEKLAARIVADYAKKGVSVVQESVVSSQPTITSRLVGDMDMIRRQMFKIAYLMTVKVFGDDAITSPGGSLLRSAMMALNDTELSKVGIQGGAYGPLPIGIARSSGSAEHALTCVRMPNLGLVSAVELFGTFTLYAVVPAIGISLPEMTGEVVYIDASTSKATISSYIEALPRILAQSA